MQCSWNCRVHDMCAPKMLNLLILLVFVSNRFVDGYKGGAPSAACIDMVPLHSGTSPSTDQSPFEVVISQEEILSNETLQVTVRQTSEGNDFKGFLIMGFNNDNQLVTGTFMASGDYKLLPCSSITNSAATHKNDTLKKSITLQWNPPANFDGTIVFKTTVLKKIDTYWVKQLSAPLKVVASGETPTTAPSLTTTSITPQIPDVYVGCGSAKGCLVVPEISCMKTQSCTTVFTHSKFNDSMLEMELYARSGRSRYFAVGFSSDTNMGDDSVVECLVDNEYMGAFMSFNYPKKFNERVDPPVAGFSVISASYIDGYLYCKIRFPANHSSHDVSFNLNEPHHVLLAYGPSQSSYIDIHDSIAATSKKIGLITDKSVMSFSKTNRVLKQLHGSFMVIAWLMAGSIAVVMPRYFRKTWVGVKYQGKDMWFVYHQGLMVTVWVLTVAGFILIFVDVGGWVAESISENPHPLIGCITTALAFIQPIMAYFRPGPNTPNRPIFNWAHSIVGYSAHILAVTCIFLAVEMEEAELPFYTYWFLTAQVCCYVVAQIALTYMAANNSPNDEQPTKTSLDEPGSGKRKLILMCLVVTSVGLSGIIIGFIINHE